MGCSNKPGEKEMKMPILFFIREQPEKEAYKFGCEGAHQMGNKWILCSMYQFTNINIKKKCLISKFLST